MKSIPLQLLTVVMENGQHGIFVGFPVTAEQAVDRPEQISEIWFSDLRDVPQAMSVSVLMELVQAQLCQSQGKVH